MYDARVFYGHIVRGDLHAAVDYLAQFPSKKRLVKKYYRIFDGGERVASCDNAFVQQVCDLFEEYDRRVFWKQQDELTALCFLCEGASKLLQREVSVPAVLDEAEAVWDPLEHALAKVVEEAGFHYIGDKTQGYYGPYIWKHSERKLYTVKLPDATEQFPLDMLTGFAFISWMNHLSLGKIGTGGWAGDDGVLSCVEKRYRYRMHTARFQVDFLKHEAQHALDKRLYPQITTSHLEYRAKLVQLIYAKNNRSLFGFVAEAGKENTENSHALASYLLVRNLSKEIFNEPLVKDFSRWKKKRAAVREAARKIYRAYPDGTELE